MKVFLSHSTKDGDFVRKLADALTADGFTPWLCEVDVNYADSFIDKINEGLAEAAFVLLIWSPEAAASKWTQKEWEAALHREVEESVTHLGIVKLRPAPIPPLLKPKVRTDATKDPEAAIGEVVAAMRRHRQKLAPVPSGAARPVTREPEGFAGRGEYLDRIYSHLVEREGIFLLHGAPGAGKSTIGLKALWRWRGRFERVVFVTCGQRPVSDAASDIALQIGVDVRSMAPEQAVATVRAALERQRTLVVLDDIWSADVRELMPAAPASVLFTSRQSRWPFVPPPHAMEVKPFSEEEAEQIFRIWLEAADVDRHRAVLLELAARWDRLPVAVVVAAELLRAQFGDMDEAARGLALEQLRNSVHDVPGLMRRAVEGLDPAARRLLEAAAVCAADGFWMPLAVAIAGLEKKEGDAARDRLVNGSLMRMLDRGRQRFAVHAVLRDQTRRGPDLVEWLGRHASAVEAVFKDGNARWRDCRECMDEVIPAVEFLATRGELERASALAYWGFHVGRRIGELEAASRILAAEERIWLAQPDGGAKAELQRIYGNQALILQDWGRLDEAMALHQKQEAICLELGNKDSLQRSYGNQALILKDWGRLDEAMALHQKEEAICLELGNKDGLQASYGNQAMILLARGDLDDAMALHQKQEAICLELGNKDGLQRGYGNQALILKDWGRLDEAMALHQKQEAICLELGNKDSLQRSYGNQALILQAWGRLDEAMALHQKQEAICLELGNKDGLQRSYGNQALILKAWGRLDEAMALHQKEEAICLELGKKDGLQASYGNQALILNAWGRLDEAMALHQKQEAICLELGNKDSLQRSYNNQALILKAWGRLDEAMALFRKQEAICRELGIQRDLAYCSWGQGGVLHAQGDPAAARAKWQSALEIFTRLKMPRERDAVQARLDRLNNADAAGA